MRKDDRTHTRRDGSGAGKGLDGPERQDALDRKGVARPCALSPCPSRLSPPILPIPSFLSILPIPALVPAQIPFEQAEKDLASTDARTRLRTVQMLKEAAYPEAAVPLARLISDPQDEVQLEAIAAELNILPRTRSCPASAWAW